MLFNSFHFLLFFPIVVLFYYLVPTKFKNIWLLIANYYFYMATDPKYVFFLIISTIITYSSGILINNANREKNKTVSIKKKKIWVSISVILNLGILIFFKYFDFILSNINLILEKTGTTIIQPSFSIILPIGISFYTFQALSYTIDAYRGDVKLEKNFVHYALFVSFFPTILSGPIEKSKTFLSQLEKERVFNSNAIKKGLMLMLWGYFQKMVIADRVAIFVNNVYTNYNEHFGFTLLFTILLYSLQIYCDFSGYSNLAIGAAQVLGFELTENFKQPYFSTSINEFWKRWHISLSTWFRDYLYFPLGGNRKGIFRRYLNLTIVFLISGLWHGASWTFVLWGAIHALYQIVGDLSRKTRIDFYQKIKININTFSFKFGQIAITFFAISFAWIFFRAPNFQTSITIIKNLFSTFNPWVLFDGTFYQMGLTQKEFYFMLMTLILLFVFDLLRKHINIRDNILKLDTVSQWTIYYCAIFSILIFGIYGPSYEVIDFIYFQF